MTTIARCNIGQKPNSIGPSLAARAISRLSCGVLGLLSQLLSKVTRLGAPLIEECSDSEPLTLAQPSEAVPPPPEPEAGATPRQKKKTAPKKVFCKPDLPPGHEYCHEPKDPNCPVCTRCKAQNKAARRHVRDVRPLGPDEKPTDEDAEIPRRLAI